MTVIPRRLSIDDDGYDPALGAHLRVCLDGVDQYGRLTAYDADAGTVTRWKLNEAGEAYVEDDQFAMETVHGVVTVEWDRLTLPVRDLLYGDGVSVCHGLLPASPRPLPPSTMTRQRRRAAERERG